MIHISAHVLIAKLPVGCIDWCLILANTPMYSFHRSYLLIPKTPPPPLAHTATNIINYKESITNAIQTEGIASYVRKQVKVVVAEEL